MPKFAANLTTMFQEVEFLDRIAAAADVGFTFVECQFPYAWRPESMASRLERYNLQLIMLNAPAGDFRSGDRGFAALPHRRDEMRESFQRGLDYALILGANQLHILAGQSDSNDLVARECYERSLRWAAEQAAPHGIGILIEPVTPIDIPGYFLGNYPMAEKIIEDLALPNLKLLFDFYHRQMIHGDVASALPRLLPIVGHIQVSGVPNRNEPGSGELDDFRLLQELDELGYDGFVGCEYTPAAGTTDGLQWREKWDKPAATKDCSL